MTQNIGKKTSGPIGLVKISTKKPRWSKTWPQLHGSPRIPVRSNFAYAIAGFKQLPWVPPPKKDTLWLFNVANWEITKPWFKSSISMGHSCHSKPLNHQRVNKWDLCMQNDFCTPKNDLEECDSKSNHKHAISLWPWELRYIDEKTRASSMEYVHNVPTMTGWWYTNLSEKYESQLGLLFPIYGKIKCTLKYTIHWLSGLCHHASFFRDMRIPQKYDTNEPTQFVISNIESSIFIHNYSWSHAEKIRNSDIYIYIIYYVCI